MRILLVHNRYRQRGGEDVVLESEERLLRDHGHEVKVLLFDNSDIPSERSLVRSAKVAFGTIASADAYFRIKEAVVAFKPAIVHFHNTFPQVSPIGYRAARIAGAAVVQTVHNYRLICPAGTLLRNGRPCEDCVDKMLPWPGALHGCYRGSRSASSAAVAMLATHKLIGTYDKHVDAYIALTNFGMAKLIEGGIDAKLIHRKPNYVHDPLRAYPPSPEQRKGFLYVGRLSPEKGIEALLAAWQSCSTLSALTIVGDGPLRDRVEEEAIRDSRITHVGSVEREQVFKMLSNSAALIFPSLWYEGLPMTILEAFASATPVLASRMGAMEELITDQLTGLHFAPGSVEDMIRIFQWSEQHGTRLREMGENARRAYESNYTASVSYRLLMEIYTKAIERRVSIYERR